MKLEELDLLKVGMQVRFNSSHSNPARRSLNGKMCKIIEYNESYEGKGWKKAEGIGYLHDIVISLETIDERRKLFASLDEIELE